MWWDLLATLQEYRDQVNRSDVTRAVLMVGMVELGLTLSWRLEELPSCRRMQSGSLELLGRLCKRNAEVVSEIIENPLSLRLVLASLVRSRMIATRKAGRGKRVSANGKSKLWKNPFDELLLELTTWTAALTRRDGAPILSELTAKEVRDDLSKNGLLHTAAAIDPESVEPAMLAALGKTNSGGRLAWQVGLPEAMLHDEDAKVACLLPEWDVRRGRLVVRYHDSDVSIEWAAGKLALLQGNVETQIEVDQKPIHATGDWTATCEYSDDDVHYLEIEQPWSHGYVLQRQLMVVRDDRCGMFCDSLVKAIQTS